MVDLPDPTVGPMAFDELQRLGVLDAMLPTSTAFVAAYTKAYGAAPDKSAALGAAAVQVWAKAVETTKSLDRKTVAAAIRGQAVKDTVFGDVQFLPNGQMQPRYVVFKVVDGKNAKLEAIE